MIPSAVRNLSTPKHPVSEKFLETAQRATADGVLSTEEQEQLFRTAYYVKDPSRTELNALSSMLNQERVGVYRGDNQVDEYSEHLVVGKSVTFIEPFSFVENEPNEWDFLR